MDAFDRKNRPPPHPLEGLESPFLDQEILAGQGVEAWEPRLGALEAASPFLGTFGMPGAEWEEESPFREAEGLLEAEGGVTGEDDRKEVPDTKIAPYRWICSVTYEKDGKTLDGGSGFLISNRHVLTAAHVITDAGSGPSAPSLYVYPGRHYGGEPFGKFLAAKTRVPNFRMDFGLITLNRPVDPGLLWWGHPSTNTEWWSEALIPFQELRQRAFPIITAGFPGVKDAYRRRMYEAQGVTVPATFGGVFRHTADTTQGQSGSPLWTERGGRLILIGIVRGYDQSPNQIAVFTHDRIVRGQVERWMAEDAPRPRPVQRRIALEIPNRWVCRLEVYDNDLRRAVGYGTGLLISNHHVLTSASVIHGFSKDRRRYSVRITPGYEFGKEALGSTTASRARVSPKFSPESNDASADYGLLTLSRALGSVKYSSIGNAALGSWGGPSHGLSSSAADWSGKEVRIAAFSRSAGGGGGYHKLREGSSDRILGLQGGQILQKASSKLDAPGAPIWVAGSGKRLLVGIASPIFSKDSDVNRGCYLSQETLSHLMGWINEDFERKELEAGEQFSQDELESLLAAPNAEAEGTVETYPEQELQDEYLDAESSADLYHDADVDQFTEPAADNGERQGEESDALDEGEIIGTVDDRVHVANTRVVPNRWICAIDVKAKDAAGARGSGVLVGPRHVLTAAHVMRAGAVWDAKFSPARNGDNTSHPFGRFGVKRVRYASDYWVERQRVINGRVVREKVQRRDDYALVTLDRDLPAQLGFWGQDPAQAQLRALATTALNGSEVTVTGYPGDRCGTTPILGSNEEDKARRMGECWSRRPDEWASTQWRASGTAHAFDTTPTVFYGADTYKGQSGGPVSLVIGGVHVCAGIHVNGDSAQNWGVRVTLRMLEDLRAWINADAGAEIASVAGDALVFGAAVQRFESPYPELFFPDNDFAAEVE